MTITRQDIKILKSDNVSDFDDGGGRVTAREVIDGESNDLFSDIPDTSRAYGDVDMVKIYPAVTTQDNDALLGSIFSLGRLPEDESVNITLFTTKDWFDTRKQAIKTLESYLAPSVKADGELLENQLKGQQVIQMIFTLEGTVPAVGKSLYLVQNEDTPTAFDQYVFVTAVQVQERTFRVSGADTKFKVATLELSTKLDYTFNGLSPSSYSSGANALAVVRDTRVADNSNYYTTKPLVESRTMGEASVKVNDIFTQLVPSARQDKPLSGLNPSGTSAALAPVGNVVTVSLDYYTPNSQIAYNLGSSITPSSMLITFGASTITEEGGSLQIAGIAVGFIDYVSGVLSWLPSFSAGADTLTISYTPAALIPTINESLPLEVTEGNRGLSLTWTLGSVPLAGSLIVTYVVLGDIYTLRDLGSGVLRGANESFGVGRVSYDTGDVLLSFGSEPDVGSHVLFTWANANGVSNLTVGLPKRLAFTHTLAPAPAGREIKPSTILVTWDDKTATVVDGLIQGDATGTFNPRTGVLAVEPNLLPSKGTAYSVSYKHYPRFNINLAGTAGVVLTQAPTSYHERDSIILDFTVDVSDPNLLRGTFAFTLEVFIVQNLPFRATYGRRMVTFNEGDTTGDLGKIYYQAGVTSYNQSNIPAPVDTLVEVGTINYLTGAVRLVVSAAKYTWWEQEYDHTMSVFGSARYISK